MDHPDSPTPRSPSWPRRALTAFRPQGRAQVVAGIIALCFLTGAVGYFVGTRQTVPSSAVDVGFLLDMSDHHEQAISLAACGADRATDHVVRGFAREVLVFQDRELGRMENFLNERDVVRPTAEGRDAMGWMGQTATVETMPGMATSEQVRALCVGSGIEVDRQFLTLMRAHHLGGAHMAEYAAANAADPAIRQLASIMLVNQRTEANEYAHALEKLGTG